MKKSDEPIQLWDGKWYRIDDTYLHYCCSCNLAHDVTFKLEKGTLWHRWQVNPKETRKARATARRKREKRGRT